ncbi:trehalose-phosphatase [uncultured Erythrobacter sp.]|uniref:trehalose-phosphatase n=1 Tax=uncultured Erythrobacter sp. TaxID=263913 RepID=UPI0026256662|nr:trehalose-phosphatase [uncultured Erythrobacter sp.]
MHSALALGAPPALATLLTGEGIALFLDFDGTLVELAPRPNAISPIMKFASRCANLADRLEGRCALVSGRSIDDIERHVGPLNMAIAGSHGSDIRSANGASLGDGACPLPAEIETALRNFAAERDVDYEHKPHGGALHYRRNPSQGASAEAFARNLAQKHGWKAQSGKCVIEIVAGKSDKGSAVHTFMASSVFKGARPFFIGDDLTDEAGFAACRELGGAGVLVGTREETVAQYRLPDVSSVHTWLEI